MNHTKRLLRIAEKILADVHFSTQQEFDEYLKNHPNYRENTKFYVNGVQVKAPPREKNNNSSEMTDEQKRLDRLSRDEDVNVRDEVADNPLTHPKTLDRLSRDEDRIVRIYVAENPRASLKTLDRLSRDEDWQVRASVADNPRTSLETLEKLSRDKDKRVRYYVAKSMFRKI